MTQKTIHDIATSSPFTSLNGSEELILWKDNATKGGLITVIRDWVIGSIPDASATQRGMMSNAAFNRIQNLSVVASTGSYSDLNNKPSLAPVATSNDYNDLDNKPVDASDTAAGLMSSADKIKLDGIEEGSNKYVLPPASTELGGVKQGNAVADANDDTEVKAQLNALLAELRTAGVLAT